MNKKKVSVTGLGKVGLPLAAVIVESGYTVSGIDIDKQRCEKINNGKNPIPEEKGLSQLISKVGGKNLHASTDFRKAYQNCNVHIVIVPLFLKKNFQPDFSLILSVIKNIGQFLKKENLVIIETTLPPTTTEKKIQPLLEKESELKAGKDFFLAYSPERVMSGKAIERLKKFPKIIGGTDKKSGEKGLAFYKTFIPNIELVSSATTAEFIKVAEGVYRDTNIALSNELFQITETLNLDYQEIKEKANHKFCHLLNPGIGVGGHCLPAYPWFLINSFENAKLIKTARLKNDQMINFWADKIKKKIEKKKSQEKVILIRGITFRKGVKEIYHSRSIALIKLLEKSGFKVYVEDPLFSKEEIKKLKLTPFENQQTNLIFNVFELKIYEQ